MESTIPTYLLLGSNLGDRSRNLLQAREKIDERLAPITRASKVYVTEAWGKTDQPDFLNQVLQINTAKNPLDVLGIILGIERDMGRVREEKWGERLIDIDILLYGNEVISESNLEIPHSRMTQRKFTLVPLAEISPQFVHPIFKKTISQLLKSCNDPLDVKPFKTAGS